VILLFAFLWLSITCWSFSFYFFLFFFFSLVLLHVGVVNALIKGEIEDHVWFEDRWRDPVASGVKCGPHGGMNSKMKSWTVSW
jgi:hypothetical protein